MEKLRNLIIVVTAAFFISTTAMDAYSGELNTDDVKFLILYLLLIFSYWMRNYKSEN
jgi:hypothetical protein